MTATLTPRQQAFVEEYLVDLNSVQAALRAGYSKATARAQSSRLLAIVGVQAAIQAGQETRSKATGITAERVLRELALIGFANMGDYMTVGSDGDPVLDFGSLTRDQTAALVEVTVDDYMDGRGEDAREVKRVKFKLADKRAALVDLGKHLSLFTERVDHSSSDGTMTPKRIELVGVAPVSDE